MKSSKKNFVLEWGTGISTRNVYKYKSERKTQKGTYIISAVFLVLHYIKSRIKKMRKYSLIF